MNRFAALFLATFALFAAPLAAAQPIVVFAPEDTKPALDEAVKLYGARGDVRVEYASSVALVRKLQQGAKADILIVADAPPMDFAEEDGLVSGETRIDLLEGELAFFAPAGSTLSFKIEPKFPIVKYLAGGRLAMGATDAGVFGKFGFNALNVADVWRAAAPSVVTVKAPKEALDMVANGEAALALTLLSDGVNDSRLRIAAQFYGGTHLPIAYPAALIGQRKEAAAFLAFLQGGETTGIFLKAGFRRPGY